MESTGNAENADMLSIQLDVAALGLKEKGLHRELAPFRA